MINEEVLKEKLKYLIRIAAKGRLFDIMDMYFEFTYTNESHDKIESYDIDVQFDYEGPLEFDMYSFAHDIQRMSEKLRDVLSEYVISREGKLVSGINSNCFSGEPMIFSIEYKVDEKHLFDFGYRFNYAED
jgi:predicted AlkP superfamily phosphohydrolase/phosphomutase